MILRRGVACAVADTAPIVRPENRIAVGGQNRVVAAGAGSETELVCRLRASVGLDHQRITLARLVVDRIEKEPFR